MMYDPPSGWKYGFPKPYLPKPNESIVQTLLRDKYPQSEIDKISWPDGKVWGIRFIGTES